MNKEECIVEPDTVRIEATEYDLMDEEEIEDWNLVEETIQEEKDYLESLRDWDFN